MGLCFSFSDGDGDERVNEFNHFADVDDVSLLYTEFNTRDYMKIKTYARNVLYLTGLLPTENTVTNVRSDESKSEILPENVDV